MNVNMIKRYDSRKSYHIDFHIFSWSRLHGGRPEYCVRCYQYNNHPSNLVYEEWFKGHDRAVLFAKKLGAMLDADITVPRWIGAELKWPNGSHAAERYCIKNKGTRTVKHNQSFYVKGDGHEV